ncbi:hypothetical protein Tco_0095372, partial [Tanacetum coccineum]
GAETPDQRSRKIRATSPPCEGNKEGKGKGFKCQLGGWKKGDKDRTPAEAPILMRNRESHTSKRKSLRVDSKVPLVDFSGERSWPLREVPLEITIGDNPLTRTEVLNFFIVRSNSPHNLLLRRTAMQRMGIVLSTIHKAIKFHTHSGNGTVFSTYEPNIAEERQKKLKETLMEAEKDVISCVDAKEKIIIIDKYPEETVII